jgi:hypothetical protein
MKKLLSFAVTVAFILASIFVQSINVNADGVTQRTTMLDLSSSEFSSDQSNASEGWSWEVSTKTLTLNSVNFNTGSSPAIKIDGNVNVTFILNGTSTLTSAGKVIDRVNGTGSLTTGIVISGSGELDVIKTGGGDAVEVSCLTVNSGIFKVTGGDVLVYNDAYINGGSLIIDSSSASGVTGLYVPGSVNIAGGNVNIKANTVGIFVPGSGHPNPAIGINITGGNITLNGGQADIWAGYDAPHGNPKDIFISGATIDFGSSPRAIYSRVGNITVQNGTYHTANVTTAILSHKWTAGAYTVNIADADYTDVDIQTARIPADLTQYTDESATAVTDAKAATVGKNILEQDSLDNVLTPALKNAIDSLQYKAADYSKVDAAIAKIPADLSLYTDETVKVLTDAKDEVIEGKNITEQSTVDGYAAAIDNAISSLKYKAADYSKVDAAIAKIPADLSLYTDETIKTLTDAKNAAAKGKNISEQSIVDGYATEIEKAISSLKYKAADYSKVDAAIAKIPADLSVYTDETVKALTTAKEAAAEGKNVTEQSAVNGYADAINAALKALVYKEADYAKVNAAIATVPSDLSIYTDDTVETLKNVLNVVVRGKNITEQKVVDQYAVAIENAVNGLTEKPVLASSDANSPQTGDMSNILLWVCLLFLSGGVFQIAKITKKLRKEKETI